MLKAMEEKLVDGCPVSYIRKRMDDGTDVLLGEATVQRSEYTETVDPDERDRLTEINASYEVGDPRIVYSLGCE